MGAGEAAARAGAGRYARENVGEGMAGAWRQVRADPAIQFELPAAHQPPPPAWLRWLLDHLGWLEGTGRIFFWAAVALAAAGLVWLLVRVLRRYRRPSTAVTATPEWQPEAATARALLAEADALAAEGRFDAAARLLLHRSVEDVASHHPALVRPAATAREIGAAAAFPIAARVAFRPIVAAVERSLFAGRALSAEEWAEARAAYREFALPGTWA